MPWHMTPHAAWPCSSAEGQKRFSAHTGFWASAIELVLIVLIIACIAAALEQNEAFLIFFQNTPSFTLNGP